MMREKYAIFVTTSVKTGFLVMISPWDAIGYDGLKA
jgi:hypothetical protein